MHATLIVTIADGSILKLRKTQKVIRYVRYNKEQDLENYFREQLVVLSMEK